MLNEFSQKVTPFSEKAKNFILNTAVPVLLTLTFGFLIVAAAATNPVVLGFVLAGGIALFIANFYLADEKGVTPFSKAVSRDLNWLGFFQYNKLKETATDLFLNVIQNPDSKQQENHYNNK